MKKMTFQISKNNFSEIKNLLENHCKIDIFCLEKQHFRSRKVSKKFAVPIHQATSTESRLFTSFWKEARDPS